VKPITKRIRRLAGVVLSSSVIISLVGAVVIPAQAAPLNMARYGTSADEAFTTLTGLSTGDFVTTGYQYNRSTNHWRTFAMKYDDTGKRTWSKDLAMEPYFAFESGSQIILADDEGRAAALNRSGETLWAQTLSSAEPRRCETMWSFTPSANGFLALRDCGNWNPDEPSTLVGRYSPQGELEWEHYAPTGMFDLAQVLVGTKDGGFIVGGRRDNGNRPDCTDCLYVGPTDPVISKFDPAGNLEWTYTDDRSAPAYAGTGFSYNGITQLSDGGYVALMRVEASNSDISILTRFDANGHKVWESTGSCDAASVYHPQTQIVEFDGGFVSIGADQNSICKWTSDGESSWGVTYQGVTFQAVVADGHGGLIAAGDAGKSASVAGGNSGGKDAVIGHFDAAGQLSPWPGVLWPTPSPTVNDTSPVVDQVLSAVPGVWGPTGVGLAYQWSRRSPSGTVRSIAGATTATYQVKAADVGYKLRVRVTGSLTGLTSVSKYSAWTSSTSKAVFTTAPTPTVAGVVRVGMPLTAVPGSWDPSASLKYQWYRISSTGASTAITRATKATYKPTSADRGRLLKLRVKGYRSGYVTTTRYSEATSAVQAGMAGVSPKISDTTPTIDQQLVANEGAWDPVDTTFAYQWYAKSPSGKTYTISGATGKTYEVAGKYAGYKIKVAVTGSKPDYASVLKASSYTSAVAKASFTVKPSPTITGAVQVGQTLTANENTWVPAPTSFKYQWYRSGMVISGKTGKTYTLMSSDRGKAITVKVTAIRAGYTSATSTSPPTALVTSVVAVDAANQLTHDFTAPTLSSSKSTLDHLAVVTPGSMTGYSRDLFPHWRDATAWGWPAIPNAFCDVRQATLYRDGTTVSYTSTCSITSGSWLDPYSGASLSAASDVDIDHIVPLAAAWRSGAASWTTDRRTQFANDKLVVIAADDGLNAAKGDKTPDLWKPPNSAAHCLYAKRWTAIKDTYQLSVSSPEKSALQTMLNTCES